ncbi:phosphoribosylglycinamide formyltransferase [Dietzia sp.]|uniref:phosphoribosylglycinamide formyltransferase n=1 Tax=Dietzia sp. TaxID=1871616 RepID=UPI002FD8E103
MNAPEPTPDQGTPIVVLASGGGTLLQAILDASAKLPGRPYRVVGVVTDRECPANERARAAGIPTEVVELGNAAAREEWDASLTDVVTSFGAELIVSAGFMKILGPAFLAVFGGRTINTHPALLPAFPGAHGVRDALAYGVKVTGCTVHLVDAGVDTGPILAQRALEVYEGELESQLHERIKALERDLIVATIVGVATGGVDLAAAARGGTAGRGSG